MFLSRFVETSVLLLFNHFLWESCGSNGASKKVARVTEALLGWFDWTSEWLGYIFSFSGRFRNPQVTLPNLGIFNRLGTISRRTNSWIISSKIAVLEELTQIASMSCDLVFRNPTKRSVIRYDCIFSGDRELCREKTSIQTDCNRSFSVAVGVDIASIVSVNWIALTHLSVQSPWGLSMSSIHLEQVLHRRIASSRALIYAWKAINFIRFWAHILLDSNQTLALDGILINFNERDL